MLDRARNRMKKQVDKNRKERHFEVGDQVYLKLQLYKRASLKAHNVHKLMPRYFVPFSILQRIGSVAYRLDLPPTIHIHPVVHISLLK